MATRKELLKKLTLLQNKPEPRNVDAQLKYRGDIKEVKRQLQGSGDIRDQLRNCYFNLRGEFMDNLDTSKSKRAVEIRESRDALLRTRDEREALYVELHDLKAKVEMFTTQASLLAKDINRLERKRMDLIREVQKVVAQRGQYEQDGVWSMVNGREVWDNEWKDSDLFKSIMWLQSEASRMRDDIMALPKKVEFVKAKVAKLKAKQNKVRRAIGRVKKQQKAARKVVS